MKKTAVIPLAALLAIALALAAGCGGSGTTVVTEDGESVTIDEKTGEMTVRTEEGETTITTRELTEEDIGVPVYPGAKTDPEAMQSYQATTEQGEATYSGAAFFTDDTVSKVVEWYRKELAGESGFMDLSAAAEGEEVGMFMFSEGDTMKTVTIAPANPGDPGKTMIAIGMATGANFMPE